MTSFRKRCLTSCRNSASAARLYETWQKLIILDSSRERQSLATRRLQGESKTVVYRISRLKSLGAEKGYDRKFDQETKSLNVKPVS